MKSTVLFITAFFALSHQQDYYWREYFGEIPEDAFVAGKNLDGTKIYLGQGTYIGYGLIPSAISPGIKQIPVNWGHVIQMSKFNKILCGPQERFYWMEASGADLHLRVVGKHAVIGGYNNQYYINIGRVSEGDNLKIAKIDSFVVGGAPFYFNDNSRRSLTSYEILMYNTTQDQILVDPRSSFDNDSLRTY